MQQGSSTTAPVTNTTNSLDKKTFNNQEKPKDIRKSNIIASKGIIHIK